MSDAWLEVLSPEECTDHLRLNAVGRIAVVVDRLPVVLPVNYRLAETSETSWIVLRTRPGSVIDRASRDAAFEIDGIDPVHQRGWSVLVRGTLYDLDPDDVESRTLYDPNPWILNERDAWAVIKPFSVTGRRLHSATLEWAFHARAYL